MHISTFGAVGDGVTDDTAAIQSGLDWLKAGSNRTLTFDNAVYVVGSKLEHYNGSPYYRIEGNGATIKAQDGRSVGGGEYMIQFFDSHAGTVENMTFDGNRDNRVPEESTSQSVIVTSCDGMTFDNVWSNNAPVDGWLIMSIDQFDPTKSPKDTRLINSGALNAWRNGLTLATSTRFRAYNSVFNDTNGAAPQFGVDIEPDDIAAAGNVDPQFHHCEASNNVGGGLMVTRPNSEAYLYNFTANNNGGYGINHSGARLVLDGFTANDYGTGITAVIAITANAGEAVLKNIAMDGINSDNINTPAIVSRGSGELIDISGATLTNSQSALMFCSGTTQARDLAAYNYAGSYPCIFAAWGQSSFKNADIQLTGNAKGFYGTGPDLFISGMNIHDSDAQAAFHLAPGAIRGIVTDSKVFHNSGVSGSQYGFWLQEPNVQYSNLHAFSKGVNYLPGNEVKIG